MPHPSWHNLVPISLPHLQIAPCTLPPTTIPTLDTSPATTSIQGNDLAKFLAKGCGCKKACGRPCYTLFPKEHYQEIRWQCAELTRNELDMVLMGQIMATMSNDTVIQAAKFRHTPTQRKLSSMAFFHGGHQVCGKTFRKLHGIVMNADITLRLT